MTFPSAGQWQSIRTNFERLMTHELDISRYGVATEVRPGEYGRGSLSSHLIAQQGRYYVESETREINNQLVKNEIEKIWVPYGTDVQIGDIVTSAVDQESAEQLTDNMRVSSVERYESHIEATIQAAQGAV